MKDGTVTGILCEDDYLKLLQQAVAVIEVHDYNLLNN
jgi:hypothetical protein